jgi:uncharacterized protein (DUF1800 family)
MWTANLSTKRQSGAAALCLAMVSITIAGCGFSLNQAAIIKMSAIEATGNNLRVTQTMQFKTEAPVIWSVNGIPGGNADIGTISGTGFYTAPAIVPLPNNQVTIGSSADIYPSSKGSYGVSVLNPIPIVTTITPGSFSEGNAQIVVNGSAFVYGAQILWNGQAVPTTYISGTQLVAVITENTPGTYPVTVVNPDPGSASSKSVNALVQPGQVVIQLQPSETSVRVNNTITITPTVTGSQDTALTWTVNGVAGGNTQIGTINAKGVYTAPAVVPNPNLVVVQATSVDNPNSVTIVNVQVLNPVPILLNASPSTVNIGSTSVVLAGESFINGASVLENGSPIPTQFNSSTQLTATVDPTVAGPFDLQVLNPDPGGSVSADVVEQVPGTPPAPLVLPQDASRFLMQATFGGSEADINHLSAIGYNAWFAEQFAIPNTLHEPYAERQIMLNNQPACAATDATCNQKLFLQTGGDPYFEQPFWSSALTGKDALRKRVQFALSELFVISSQDAIVGQMPRGVAGYYDMLGNDAFTNYRQLLQDVTLSPMMGIYLSILANDKGDANRDPDENYAREVMQLLTIGLNQLNPDGSTQVDGSGNPVPTYGLNDVVGMAKIFTGFSWNMNGNTSDQAWSGYGASYAGPGYGQDLLPLVPYPAHHSTDEKDFLGVTVPAGGSDPSGDLKIALDTLFNHPNTPIFVSKQLIQRLVTSNPSPAYLQRVAAVFKDNGQGVRGDMQAVITAILMDDEARNTNSPTFTSPNYGRVQEPLVRFAHMARAFTAESRSGAFDVGSTEDPAYGFAEMASRAPSIFNWFAPGYIPAGTTIEQAGLTAPEMEITDVTTVIGYLNSMQAALSGGYGNNNDLYMTLATETALANNPDALLDRVNLLLLAGNMSSTLRSQILAAVSAISVPAGGDANAINNALLARAQTAIFLTVASSEYTAQH